MTKKEKVSLNVQDNDLNNIKIIKDTVKDCIEEIKMMFLNI